MYKVKNGTDSADRVYSGSAGKSRNSEAERLRSKGEALRHSRRNARSGKVVRNREEEQKRSQQLRERSGSRYADKRSDSGPVSGASSSRYADKQAAASAPVKRHPGRRSGSQRAAIAMQAKRAETRSARPDRSRRAPAAQAAPQPIAAAAPAANGYAVNAPNEQVNAPAVRPGLWQRWIAGLKRGDSLAVAVLAVVMTLIIGYSVVALFYSSHFYSGTTILGIDCGKLDVEQAKAAVTARIGEYTLEVDGRSGSEVIPAEAVGFTYKDEGGMEKLLASQKSWMWPVMMLLHPDTVLEVGTRYDHSRIADVVAKMACFSEENAIAPKDAYLGTDENGYVVVPEQPGALPDVKAVSALLTQALDQGRTKVSLEDADCYVKPQVTSDDPLLNEVAQKRNKLLGAKITIPFGNFNEVVDTQKLISFMAENRAGEYYISSDRIKAYVAQLANKYDTYGEYRSFRTSLGTAVDLYGGDYGWLLDQEATADELAECIRRKMVTTLDPIYTYTAMDRGLNDIGDTYVEICISLQEMWCYQDGVLMVDTPVVTGNPNRNNATPSGGVWAIDAKMQDYTLVGADYRTPVSFWMPFNGNVGIHDLKARYYFGGTIYLYNGSHGCVNTPLDAVEQIYNIVSVGTPVIVYE